MWRYGRTGARSEGDHNRAALERVERRLAQLEGGNGRVEGLKDPLVAAAERLSTRDARYPPPPNGHYDARGPRGTPNGHSAPPNGHYGGRAERPTATVPRTATTRRRRAAGPAVASEQRRGAAALPDARRRAERPRRAAERPLRRPRAARAAAERAPSAASE